MVRRREVVYIDETRRQCGALAVEFVPLGDGPVLDDALGEAAVGLPQPSCVGNEAEYWLQAAADITGEQ